MFCYNVVNGMAENIRFVPDDYAPRAGELSGNAEPLPSAEELSDPVAWAKIANAPIVEQPTLADILDALPQESKDAVAAKVASRAAGVTLVAAAGAKITGT